MPYYALLYEEVIDDFIARRGVYRDEHLRLAREAQARNCRLCTTILLLRHISGALLFREHFSRFFVFCIDG